MTSLAMLAAILPWPVANASSERLVGAEDRYRERIVPLLQHYCYRCHSGEVIKGGVDLSKFPDGGSVLKDRRLWGSVSENVEAGIMPPEGDLPSEAEIAEVVNWVQSTLSSADCDLAQPGRVTLRRLNRVEYNNTIRDLTGVDFHPADDFPADDVGYGFDNIGDVLTLPPLLLEKYLDAAEQVAAKAIVVPRPDEGAVRRLPGGRLEGGHPFEETSRALWSNGELTTRFGLGESGRYLIRVRAFGQQAGDEPIKMAVRVDGRQVATFEVAAEKSRPAEYDIPLELTPGSRRVGIAFLNDFTDPKNPDPSRRDRNLIVEAVEVRGPVGPPLWPIAEVRGRDLKGGDRSGRARSLPSTGEITAEVDFPAAGTYRIVAHAYGTQAGPEPCKAAVKVDGKDVAIVEVPATEAEPGTYEVPARVEKGKHKVAVAFLNDYYKPDATDPKDRGDRNLYVSGIDVLGHQPGHLPASHNRIITRRPSGESDWQQPAREVVERFMSRAYRRPVRPEEVARVLKLFHLVRAEGKPFERGVQLAVTAILVNPNFLYRVETEYAAGVAGKGGIVRELTDWELASRLSYFLWSSMPDEPLFQLASQGKLKDEAVLEAQARRMLKDPKARALVDNFATQWLTLRSVRNINPDPRKFKGFDGKLRDDMVRETELFFESIIREDRNVLDLLDANYSYLNARLAKHYGIVGVEGDEFRRVELPAESHRGGVLTQASVLTITSNPTRTSPVKRGKWILEQVLGTPPPPPPPDVPQLEDNGQLKGTLRQRMEQHRENPSCAVCHNKMDPLGFGFENFDAVGQWREKDGDDPIDPSGTLPTGESFAGVEQLKQMLKVERADQFTRNLAEKLLTYALGRGLDYYDACAVDLIVERCNGDGRKFSRLVVEIVRSEPFRKRTRDEGSVQ